MAIIRFYRSMYLPNFHTQCHIYYIVLCSPSVAPHWYWNKWSWVTLNGYFALKSVSGSASNGLAFWLSHKTVFKIANADLCTYCQRQKCSTGTPVNGDISFMGLFAWVSWRAGELHSWLSHMLFTDVYRKWVIYNNIYRVGQKIWHSFFSVRLNFTIMTS